MKKRFLYLLAALSLMFVFTQEANALTWNPFKRAGRVKASSLIVTGNFVYARLLADLAQYYSKQPIVLISPDVDGGSQLFYVPVGTKASPMAADEFMDIVEYINPRKVIVLGGDDFVPAKYVDLAREKYSVVTLDSEDWSKNAATLGEMLGLEKLQGLFNEYKTTLDRANAQGK